MIASPLSHWQWATQSTRAVDARVSVSTLFSEWQTQLQRNLTQLIGNDNALPEEAPSVGSLQQIGKSPTYSHVGACVVQKYRSRQVLTATRTATNGLEMASWRVNADGSVLQTGTSGMQNDQVAQLDMARAGKFVVAYRSLAGGLVLVSWSISNTGAIYRAGEHQARDFPIRSVKIVALNDELLVTACLTPSRQVALTSWRLATDATFTKIEDHEVDGELLRHLALVQMSTNGNEARFVSIARTASRQLVLHLWQVSAAGQMKLCNTQYIASEATHIQAIATKQGGLVLALRGRNGTLRLLSWRLTADQHALQLCGDTNENEAGPAIRRFDLISIDDHLMGLYSTQDRHLHLRRWHLIADGSIALRDEASFPLTVTGPVQICPELLAGNAPLLAVLFTTGGEYQLTTWAA